MPQAEPVSSRPRPLAAAPPRRRPPTARVHYPVEDDQPMSETIKHARVSVDARIVLEIHHVGRADACVGGNNFLYYEEGNPKAVVSPDVFVAYGVPKETDREVWKLWVEGKAPDFILEVTSKSTRKHDERKKKAIYERIGVTEYWQFDPTGDYLDPILKGRALADGRYRELELERRDGGLCRFSEVLGLDLRLEDGRLRFFNPKRGEYLLTPEEQHQANREQRHALEERDRTVDQQRRALEAAEARIRDLERQRRPEG
ncbi:MAG: Uma2 family endonuclease [Gammaproteobacteria bacterium]|nr:Uma2 family endonuclease [Gammaproteobacteria bacterium]